MKAHKTSGYGKMMDKVIRSFEKGKSYTNRKGTFKVICINCALMKVRYDGESRDRILNLDTQRQIIFSIADDTAIEVDASIWDTRTPKKNTLVDHAANAIAATDPVFQARRYKDPAASNK